MWQEIFRAKSALCKYAAIVSLTTKHEKWKAGNLFTVREMLGKKEYKI